MNIAASTSLTSADALANDALSLAEPAILEFPESAAPSTGEGALGTTERETAMRPTVFADTIAALQALYQGELVGFVRGRIGNRTDADDIRQQTMLQAIRGLAGFRGTNLRGWVFSIARHVIADHFRGLHQAEEVAVDEVEADELAAAPGATRSVCECRERLAHCLHCIAQQGDIAEEVALLLANLHGRRDRDSAAMLGMTLTSFKWLLHCARQRMHEHACGACPLIAQSGLSASCARGLGAEKRANGGAVNRDDRGHVPRRGLSRAELQVLRSELLHGLGM